MDGNLENIISHEKYYTLLLYYIQDQTDDYKKIKNIIDTNISKGSNTVFNEMVIAKPLPKVKFEMENDTTFSVKNFHLMEIKDIEKVMIDIDSKLGSDGLLHFYGYDSPNKITDALINVGRAFNDVVMDKSVNIKEFQKNKSFYKSKFDWINLFGLFGFVKIGEIVQLEGIREFMAVFKKQKSIVTINEMDSSMVRSYAQKNNVNDKDLNMVKLKRAILYGKRIL
jgi:hypothetical protein